MSRTYEISKGEKQNEVSITITVSKTHKFTIKELKKKREQLLGSLEEANLTWKNVVQKIEFEITEIDDYIQKAIVAGVEEKPKEAT